MRFFAVALCAILVAACSGGGSGGTTTAALVNSFGEPVGNDYGGNDSAAAGADGTAGDGAPIPNAPITVRDSTGKTVTGTTDKLGYYQVVVTGFTAPMIASVVRSDGTIWYSPSIAPVTARKFVTINLNALTDKVAADVAKASGATGGAAGLTTAMVNTAALQTAKTDLVTQLTAKIVAAGLDPKTFDPVTTLFKAVTTDAYDKLLESVVAVKDPATGETVVTATTTADTKPALQLAKDFLASVDSALIKGFTAAPLDSDYFDNCVLDNGLTKASSQELYQANPKNDWWVGSEPNKYLVGSKRSGVSVLSDVVTDNSDGSNRRLIKVQYQIDYADGTTTNNETSTLISGSSYGSTMASGQLCSTVSSSKNLRFYGNRALVFTGVRPINYASSGYRLVDGQINGIPSMRNAVRLRVIDPGKNATYAIVKGQGLPADGAILLSPRVMRDDPAFGNIRGKYVDWSDQDNFRMCRDASNVAIVNAPDAQCAVNGASSPEIGAGGQAAVADSEFAKLGFVKGGQYSYAIYNDDGWKTKGGYLSKTPIASYTRTLNTLPYSAVTLQSTINDPAWAITGITPEQAAQAFRDKQAMSLTFAWNNVAGIPLPDSTKLGWGGMYVYREGKVNATQPNFWPASRQSFDAYPDYGTSSLAITAPAPSGNMSTATYGEVGFYLANRNNQQIYVYLFFN